MHSICRHLQEQLKRWATTCKLLNKMQIILKHFLGVKDLKRDFLFYTKTVCLQCALLTFPSHNFKGFKINIYKLAFQCARCAPSNLGKIICHLWGTFYFYKAEITLFGVKGYWTQNLALYIRMCAAGGGFISLKSSFVSHDQLLDNEFRPQAPETGEIFFKTISGYFCSYFRVEVVWARWVVLLVSHENL